ncbi:hypothetical protein [uncultured Kocuria sp.]|uniref:hypothetical protein n=1 Tax=uncultured Kocuria sp. TaxID=259305 RepID=UPI0026335F74|nr:hypothetical protein [uncultured Kocuria sp.]
MSNAPDETTEGSGKGPEGTVPDNEQGIGLTADENATGFEPEEDPEAATEPGDDPGTDEEALGHS